MKRIQLLYEMDKLLTECKSCERPFSIKHVERCQGCSIYSQLREIGNQLEGKKSMGKKPGFDMEVSEYVKLSHLSASEIARKMGVEVRAISNWKYRNKEAIENALKNAPQPHSEAEEVSESARKVETDTGEIQALKAELESKDSRIEELEGLLAEAEKRIDFLTDSCGELLATQTELKNWKDKANDLEMQLTPIRQLAFLKLKQDLA